MEAAAKLACELGCAKEFLPKILKQSSYPGPSSRAALLFRYGSRDEAL
jgi:hypothetical protein